MKTQLLCTFTNSKTLSKTVDKIIQAYDILYNKLFVLRNESDTRELMCTYNIDSSGDVAILPDTISLHRKKQTNTLYTINWENYRNSILLTNDTGIRRIDTTVHEVIYIKVKK